MKLLLTSSGLTTPELIKACVDLTGKPRAKIKTAIVNEGYAVERGDKRWIIDESLQISKTLPGWLDIVDLLALSPAQIQERLNAVDVIFVLGGHTDYLMHVFNKSGLTAMLPELLKTKVYVGSSAGAMVMGKRVSTEAYQTVFGEEGDYGTTEYLGFVDFAIKPHLDSAMFPNNKKEVILNISRTYGRKLCSLRDSQGIIVQGDKITMLGGQIFCAQNGKEVQNG